MNTLVRVRQQGGVYIITEGAAGDPETILGEFLYLADVSNMLSVRRDMYKARARRFLAECDVAASCDAWEKMAANHVALNDLHG